MSVSFLIDGPESAPTFLFAHGAGAPMDSHFMDVIAKGLAEQGIRVARFEFPYMVQRRMNGGRRPPNRQPELIESFSEALASIKGPCVVGGKSMGGRMASILASEATHSNIHGVVALGYPFHPAGKPDKLRVDHFASLALPMLIVQGTRDALGNREEVQALSLPRKARVLWLEDGDHDLKPRKKSGFTHEQHLSATIAEVAKFIQNTLIAD